ncbi:hypothetical protein KEHDKFFH_18435 [Marinobacter maroccanus]|uniref:Uncharacterized protein n=1 Tax=Marinobacter maroccanus TaxID=2055143 RepID=A0A2S5Z5G9_9GAMM|nr:hypothetical protein KEHDKFFH_18435 [Marinobacter maroccanus]
MSRKAFTIDRILYEILIESPNGVFTLSGLREEFSSRSNEKVMPPNRELFWMIFMQVYAMRSAKLVSRVERPEGGSLFLIGEQFRNHPFNVVDRLFVTRWFGR